MKIAVIGDLIIDQYVMGTATRLCPEAPIPIVIPTQEKYETRGGAGLVSDQLKALIGDASVVEMFGSKSRKERTFVDGRLVLRVDYDSIIGTDSEHWSDYYGEQVVKMLTTEQIGMLLISDYGKGAIGEDAAFQIRNTAKDLDIPVFVDAKNHWPKYRGAFAMFPNQHECADGAGSDHIIQKLGQRGCSVDGQIVAGLDQEVRDVTGAGDIFLGAFAAKVLESSMLYDEPRLLEAAEFANIVAGLSVEYVGTHVVSLGEVSDYMESE